MEDLFAVTNPLLGEEAMAVLVQVGLVEQVQEKLYLVEVVALEQEVVTLKQNLVNEISGHS